MKSNKFIQLYDKDSNPILGANGLLSYDKRIKKGPAIIASLKDKLPATAKFWRIRKTMLKSLINITELFEIPANDN